MNHIMTVIILRQWLVYFLFLRNFTNFYENFWLYTLSYRNPVLPDTTRQVNYVIYNQTSDEPVSDRPACPWTWTPGGSQRSCAAETWWRRRSEPIYPTGPWTWTCWAAAAISGCGSFLTASRHGAATAGAGRGGARSLRRPAPARRRTTAAASRWTRPPVRTARPCIRPWDYACAPGSWTCAGTSWAKSPATWPARTSGNDWWWTRTLSLIAVHQTRSPGDEERCKMKINKAKKNTKWTAKMSFLTRRTRWREHVNIIINVLSTYVGDTRTKKAHSQT